jgi:hypothetical protein
MFRALFFFARSLKRIADALEEQNRITKHQLLEMHGITVPDPKQKFSRSEREAEVIYGEQPTNEQEEWSEEENRESFLDVLKRDR